MPPAESLNYFKSELFLIGILILIIIVSFWRNDPNRRLTLTLIAFSGLLLSSVPLIQSPGESVLIFNGLIRWDLFSRFFKILFLLCGGLTVLILFQAYEVQDKLLGEFYGILLSLVLGMFLLVSSFNLLMIYLSLEFVSITSYVLTGFNRNDRRSSEAALKYVIYGGVVSGIMLFGISYFFGLFGTLDLSGIREGMGALFSGSPAAGRPAVQATRLTVLAASVFVFAGFGYKMAAVPFHMWCPDVYEGAPTPFTAFLSIGPKIAGVAAFCRFLSTGFFENPVHFKAITEIPWAAILGILAAGGMTLGNLSAISQRNVKRLLAYSGVAHCGYILMGLCALSKEGFSAFYFYAVVYLFMNLGAFIIVIAVRERTGRETIEAFRGLGTREPFMAVSFAIFLFSLVGIPPLAGFIGKFYLFAAVLRQAGTGYYLLAVVGILNSVISLYYYTGIIKAMFLEKAAEDQPLQIPRFQKLITAFLLIPVLLFGIYWEPLASVTSFLF
ncbi:MAG: NADH-quinone oxidoreductase subunit N [Thermodesulfobacteriota bacterium]